MKILLQNGRLICPAGGLDETGDLLVEDGIITRLGGRIEDGADQMIDCAGLWVVPGLIDAHVHLREPGQEYKETVESGTRAAAAGGFTAVCPMPNTDPVNDSAVVTKFLLERADSLGSARVYPVGAITRGLKGESLAPLLELKEAGCPAVSDDGHPVDDSRLLRRAMEYARGAGLTVICHSEDKRLSAGGSMHEGPVSTRLGLGGIPAEAEVVAVERDLNLARLAGARVHIAHVSTAGAVEAVRRAKETGVLATAETCPHYLMLTDRDVGNYDTRRKMNPPLRSAADRQAVLRGLAEGVIDVLATDHAPHSVLEKDVEFDQAAFGVTGLETALGVALFLVEEGPLDLKRALEALSAAPARALGIPGGRLTEGGPADIAVIDPNKTWTVDPEKMYSKSRNTPFAGLRLPGRAVLTLCGGRITHRLEE